MDEELMKRLFYFSVAVLVSIFLFWFGGHFLFASATDFNKGTLLLFGIISLIGGVSLISIPDVKHGILPGVFLLAIGMYGCARAAGTIETAWLAHIFGAACWLAAGVLLYITWPARPPSSQKQNIKDVIKNSR